MPVVWKKPESSGHFPCFREKVWVFRRGLGGIPDVFGQQPVWAEIEQKIENVHGEWSSKLVGFTPVCVCEYKTAWMTMSDRLMKRGIMGKAVGVFGALRMLKKVSENMDSRVKLKMDVEAERVGSECQAFCCEGEFLFSRAFDWEVDVWWKRFIL